jgi:hypothetical protein
LQIPRQQLLAAQITEMNPKLNELAEMLQRRIAVIADHDLRDREPAKHLDQLKSVSESIATVHSELKSEIDPRLNHYLANCSYEKALEHTQGLLQKS